MPLANHKSELTFLAAMSVFYFLPSTGEYESDSCSTQERDHASVAAYTDPLQAPGCRTDHSS